MSKQKTFYCQDSHLLVEEAIRNRQTPKLASYRDDLIRNIQLEMKHLWTHQSGPKSTTVSSNLHRICIERSKRCVLAYQRERLHRLMDLFWDGGANSTTTLPEETAQAVHSAELDFFKSYQSLVTTYKGDFLDIDLGQSLAPPQEVFIEVRVVKECGQVFY